MAARLPIEAVLATLRAARALCAQRQDACAELECIDTAVDLLTRGTRPREPSMTPEAIRMRRRRVEAKSDDRTRSGPVREQPPGRPPERPPNSSPNDHPVNRRSTPSPNLSPEETRSLSPKTAKEEGRESAHANGTRPNGSPNRAPNVRADVRPTTGTVARATGERPEVALWRIWEEVAYGGLIAGSPPSKELRDCWLVLDARRHLGDPFELFRVAATSWVARKKARKAPPHFSLFAEDLAALIDAETGQSAEDKRDLIRKLRAELQTAELGAQNTDGEDRDHYEDLARHLRERLQELGAAA